MTADDPASMTHRAAARYLGVTRRTIAGLIADGSLVPDGASGARISRRQLDRYLESTRVRPGELRHLYTGRSGHRDAV